MSANLLSRESSPYLLQHKDNPVHWRPWGAEALAEARAKNKPILLSVGYAACHWCHVMAHESFEDPDTAAVMNRLFVNIKVDREERPDVDQIYMTALHALGEQGGWPLTMFLTPDGVPIWGGTYFPKTARFGRPGFTSVLEEVARVFHDEPDKVTHNTALLMEHLAARTAPPTGVTLDRDLLDRAAARLLGLMDRRHGGIKGAPKFPQATLLGFLWRAGLRTGDPAYRAAVLTTLRNICQGGIYDHLAGGFARYAVDDRWLVPHFEKMLYDNAQIVELLCHAFLRTREPLFSQRAEETIGWLTREMTTEGGAFAASIDADSEGQEGKFYTWTADEIADVLGPEEGPFFARTYGVHAAGNWEGVNILHRLGAMELLAEPDEARLAAARAKLLDRRAARVRPATDDKVLADWNGLTTAALALAGTAFQRADWTALAAGAFAFVTGSMSADGRPAHAFRAGQSTFPGLATDYADLIKAALALHGATLDPAYLATAEDLAGHLRHHHWDAAQPGYYLSADDAEALIVRPRSATDEATPGANSVMAENLIRLWHLTGRNAYRDDADAIIEASAPAVAQNLFSVTGVLSALDFRLDAVDTVIVHPPGATPDSLVAAARLRWTPNTILSVHRGSADLPADHPAAGKTCINNVVTAYVCRGETCSPPQTDPAALAKSLSPR